jgi:hypothetical protein
LKGTAEEKIRSIHAETYPLTDVLVVLHQCICGGHWTADLQALDSYREEAVTLIGGWRSLFEEGSNISKVVNIIVVYAPRFDNMPSIFHIAISCQIV